MAMSLNKLISSVQSRIAQRANFISVREQDYLLFKFLSQYQVTKAIREELKVMGKDQKLDKDVLRELCWTRQRRLATKRLISLA
jgi:hypothetical protein